MKKLHIILDLLAAAALFGAYKLKYYAVRKPGLVRWLNYNDNKLREAIPVGIVKYAVLAVAIILVAIVFSKVSKKTSEATVPDKVMTLVTAALTAYYAYATVHFTYDVSKAAFLIVPLIGFAEYLMIIRCFTSGRKGKNSKQLHEES